MTQSLLSSFHPNALTVAEIGHAAARLNQAIELGVPIAPTAIIPVSTLKDIAEYTHLADKIERYRSHLNDKDPTHHQVARASLARDIRQLEIPHEVSTYITQIYHEQLGGGFISVQTSYLTESDQPSIVHHNVKGDVNVGESLLAVWAEALTVQSDWISLFPTALVLQATPQPAISGSVSTAHPHTGNKTRVYIESVWGVLTPAQTAEADTFEIDSRTRAVVQTHQGRQKTYWQRALDTLHEQSLPMAKRHAPSLTRAQLQQLADWAIRLKQHSLHQLHLHWQLVDHQLQVTTVEQMHISAVEHTENQEVLVVGDSLIGGYIQGISCVSPSSPADFSTGQILVADALTTFHQGLIRQAAAIVTERPLTDSLLLQLIKQYHIPTIVNARYATRRLRNQEEVMVDASKGQVIRIHTDHRTPRTATMVVSSVNNPYTQVPQEADGYYFKSDFSLMYAGLSPLEIVSTSQAVILKNALVKHVIGMSTKPTWYRFSALHQGQLTPQTQGTYPDEPNPYYGTRGTLFHLHDPAVLYFELSVLKAVIEKTNQKLNLVLPFVRTPGERELLLHLITNRLGDAAGHVTFWLEAVTPDNIVNLDHYVTDRIAGVIIPITTVHAAWHGLDPENPHLLKQYPLSNSFIEQVLTYVQSVTHSFMMELTHPHRGQLELLLAQGITHMITRSTQVPAVKKQLALLEERQVTHGGD